MCRFSVSAGAVAFALCLASIAFADDRADSDKLFGEGLAAYNKKDLEGARVKFQAAYARYPSPNSLFNLARVEQVMGRNLEAWRHYRAYSELPENPKISASERAEAKQRMGEVLGKLARVVVLAPEGAKVVLDGAPQDNSAEAFPVEPGTHAVDLIVNAETRKRTLVCNPGEVHQAKWDESATTAMPPTSATAAPSTSREVDAPEPKLGPVASAGLVTAGAGVLGLLGGVAFGMVSSGNADDARAKAQPSVCADRSWPSCTSLQSSIDAANTFHTVSLAAYVAGGVLLAGGVTMVALGMKKHHEPHKALLVVPTLFPAGAGVGLTSNF